MVEAVTGVAVVGVAALAYVLLVQVLMAAIVLMCQFVLLQVRTLRAMWGEPPRPRVVPVVTDGDQDTGEGKPMYRVGGGLARWE